MNHLVVLAHPQPKSFGDGIKAAVVDAAQAAGHEIRVRDLYEIGFNPILSAHDFISIRSGSTPADILEEQKHVEWCDLMTFIYPTWWTHMPAILKGYIDRIFAYDFAYRRGSQGIEKLLTGKKAILLTTGGNSESYYESIGMIEAMKLTTDTGIFEYCGIEVIHHRYFGEVGTGEDGRRKKFLEEVRAIIPRR